MRISGLDGPIKSVIPSGAEGPCVFPPRPSRAEHRDWFFQSQSGVKGSACRASDEDQARIL